MTKKRPNGNWKAPGNPDKDARAKDAAGGKWKDRITLFLAIWGAVLGSIAGVRDMMKYIEESRPKFYVRAQVEGIVPPGEAKPIGHITVQIANTGTATATLDPTLYVLTINSKTGELADTLLTFLNPSSGGKKSDPTGAPPTLKTGEEASAVSDNLVLPIANRPLDYMAVKFKLLGGRKYIATIKYPFFITRDKGGTGGRSPRARDISDLILSHPRGMGRLFCLVPWNLRASTREAERQAIV
jgi:hypothetical protein